MDKPTVSYYDDNASQVSRKYESADMSHIAHLFLRHLPDKGSKILDLGCGSGRDAAFLLESGYNLRGVDASANMIEEALKEHPELAGRLSVEAVPLPEGSALLKETFQAVVAMAMLMHVPEQDLFQTAFQIKRMLGGGGIAFLSVSTGRMGVDAGGRDGNGRLFQERPPEELQLIFERLGFRLAAAYRTPDAFSRGILWHTLVFVLEEHGTVRSIDRIETIIRRDKKDATYKFALLRALCDIAQTASRKALWYQDGTVGIPLGLVAEKWLLYYWPLVEPDLGAGSVVFPQKRGAERNVPIAFRAPLLGLIRHYSRLGGFSCFYQDYRNQRLGATAGGLADAALNSIANTIVVGPVQYAGGALDEEESFFAFRGHRTARGRCGTAAGLEASLGEILVPAAVWKEMCLIGYWVAESIVLRWAELTVEMAEGRVRTSEVVDRLLVSPEEERDVGLAKHVYDGQPGLQCVWTGVPIRAFDVDHLIPFSLWHNNDLWNLLPAARQVNRVKKDRLVSRPTLLASRDLILRYWRLLRSGNEARFDLELERSLLRSGASRSGWEAAAFSGLAEAVETVALQRGLRRWSA